MPTKANLSFFQAKNQSQELIVDLRKYSFDKIIASLNWLILQDDKQNNKAKPPKSQEELKKRLLTAGKYLSCNQLFAHTKLTPFIGHKTNQNLYCKNLVIGLQGALFSYRVDWDPDKGLHINLKTNEDIKFAILSSLDTQRFSVPKALLEDEGFHIAQIGEFIKFKFWLKMTVGYERSQNGEVCLLQYFIDAQDNTNLLSTFKNELYTCGFSPDYTTILPESFNSHKDLIDALADQHIRDVLINILIGRFINNCYQTHPPTTPDSEQFSESPHSPK